MVELWFALFALALIVFVVLDGWNIGSGVIHFVVTSTPEERRGVIGALGPMWSWHEVWLVVAGGTFLMAFPRLMAVSFSGFYLALWMVVWTFLLRGISIEVGGHIHDPLWQSAWDFVFAFSSVLLAALLGVAIGNIVRGVPLDAAGAFRMPLFTNFRVVGYVGLLDWYTMSTAVFTIVVLAAHGATYLRLKTTDGLHDRSERWARRLWPVALALFLAVSLETWIVRPDFHQGLVSRPLAWIFVAALCASVWALWTGLHGRDERRAFAGSCGVLVSVLGAAAAAVFPVVLRSTVEPAYSLTAYAGAAGGRGPVVALVWWPLALVLAFIYFWTVARRYGGKIANYH